MSIYPIFNVTDRNQNIHLLEKFIQSKFDMVQIRSKLKYSDTITFVEAALFLKKKNNSNTKIIVNDYVDICIRLEADGVHLGQKDTNPIEARKVLGKNKIIGLSCHEIAHLHAAPKEVLSYVALGPIYSSKTKIGHAPIIGIEKLKEFVHQSPLPVVAIGGINLKNYSQALEAGAQYCAMISALEDQDADNLRALSKNEILS